MHRGARYGGLGHTLGLHCEDEAVIRAFAIEKPVNRIVVNSPTSQGAVGYTTNLFPSMTLGCGSFGGNITSDNIGPQHLLNIKRVARVRPEYRAGEMSGEFPHLPPGGEPVPASSPWSEVVESQRRSALRIRAGAPAPRKSRAHPLFSRRRAEHHCDSPQGPGRSLKAGRRKRDRAP